MARCVRVLRNLRNDQHRRREVLRRHEVARATSARIYEEAEPVLAKRQAVVLGGESPFPRAVCADGSSPGTGQTGRSRSSDMPSPVIRHGDCRFAAGG